MSQSSQKNGFRLSLMVALLLVSLVALWFFGIRKPPADKPEVANLKLPADRLELVNPVSALILERKRLGETVWQEEVQAQSYEGFFVKLWDDLRAAVDKIKVLENVSFESLEWGQPQEVSQSDLQFLVTDCGGPVRQMNSAEFAEQLRTFAKDGFRIVQTEWHHSRFEVGEPGEARSTVFIRIDAVNESRQTRFTITGDILSKSFADA